MNKKLLTILGSVGAAVIFPVLVLAAFNDVQFTANTNVVLTDAIGSATLIVTSTSQVATMTVATGSIAIGLESGSAITFLMTTPTRRTLLVTPAIATFDCGSTTSTLNLTSASTQTVTVTMGDTCIQDFVATPFQAGAAVTVPLSWNGSSTFYSITTTLASTGAVVSTATTSLQNYVVSGLTCGTIYLFSVRGATNNVESNTVSGSARTQLCPAVAAAPSGGSGGGGGGVIVAPAPTPVKVTTTTPAITTTTTVTTAQTTAQTAAGQTPAVLPPSCPVIKAGDMVKVQGRPAIYAVDKNFLILYFPSGDEFKSWNSDDKYGGYTTVSQTCFDDLKVPKAYPGAINFRPGSYVVKRASSSQLYVVLPGNKLAKITSAAAKALYGNFFKAFVVTDPFWPHYVKRGADVAEGKPHEGMIVSNSGKNWYVAAGNILREITAEGLAANRFKTTFIRPVGAAMIEGYAIGDKVVTLEASVANRTID